MHAGALLMELGRHTSEERVLSSAERSIRARDSSPRSPPIEGLRAENESDPKRICHELRPHPRMDA